jgi:hypothetical protein
MDAPDVRSIRCSIPLIDDNPLGVSQERYP